MPITEARLIIDSRKNPYYNMGFDEALLVLKNQGVIPPTLRLYMWSPSTVTIGYFQRIRDVVNLEYAEKHNIPVVRRITGGGAVYHDMYGEITYSIVLDAKGSLLDVQESYRIICSGLVEALRHVGLEASFAPVNDIIVNNKKISGSAQTRKRNTILQHGTLLVSSNLDIMEKVLVVPKEKLISHKVVSIKDRVTTVSTELGRDIEPEDLIPYLIKGFEKALNLKLVEEKPSTKEVRLAEELSEKYRKHEWNFKR